MLHHAIPHCTMRHCTAPHYMHATLCYTNGLRYTGLTTELCSQASHRLLVYVDDMQRALINLELEISDLFGGTL